MMTRLFKINKKCIEETKVTLYTGFSGIKCTESQLNHVRFSTYVSSSLKKNIALRFLNGGGMLVQFTIESRCLFINCNTCTCIVLFRFKRI